jgi:hypothetical protein
VRGRSACAQSQRRGKNHEFTLTAPNGTPRHRFPGLSGRADWAAMLISARAGLI